MSAILIATRNAHKAREIEKILGKDFAFFTLNDFPGTPTAMEDADSFEGNARKKCSTLTKWVAINTQLALKKVVTIEAPFYVLADDLDWRWTR